MIALLTSSVGIELLSSSATITSFKSEKMIIPGIPGSNKKGHSWLFRDDQTSGKGWAVCLVAFLKVINLGQVYLGGRMCEARTQ